MKSSRIKLAILFTTIAGCLAILLAMPVQAHNQELLGEWKMISTAPDNDNNDVHWTLTIAYQSGKYDATASTDESTGPVGDLHVEGNSVHFSVEYDGYDYAVDLKLEGDSLTGTWSGRGTSGETRGRKAAKT